MIEGFIGGGVGAVAAFVFVIAMLRSVIRVCPPDQVLVVTGAKTTIRGKSYGFRLQRGDGRSSFRSSRACRGWG